MHSLHHLELVNALAKYRHFGRAAGELGISQPALSKGLSHLETALGVKLFARVAPIAPTPFGEIILQRSGRLVTAFEELLREIELAKGTELVTFRIASDIYPAEIFVPEAIAELSRQTPSIRSTLAIRNFASVIDDVVNARCDLGISDTRRVAENPDIVTALIRTVECQVYCRAGHPITTAGAPQFSDLFSYPFVGPSIPDGLRGLLPYETGPFAIRDDATGEMAPRIEVDTYGAAKRIVMAGDALSAAPSHLLAADIAAKRFAAVPLALPPLTLNYGFIWRRERTLSPVTQSFMKIARSLEARAHAR